MLKHTKRNLIDFEISNKSSEINAIGKLTKEKFNDLINKYLNL